MSQPLTDPIPPPSEDARTRAREVSWFDQPLSPLAQHYFDQMLAQGFPHFCTDPLVISQIAAMIREARAKGKGSEPAPGAPVRQGDAASLRPSRSGPQAATRRTTQS